MTIFNIFDFIGTIVFAISGALVAMNKKFDPFGVFIIAFVTAVGGGTIRDVLVGRQPVGWMMDINYVYFIILATILAILFRSKLKHLHKSLFLFDTIGLGIFTIVGTEIGVNANLHPIISIALGTMTAAFGGVIRDTLCNEIPVIFRKEIYATASILGAITFLILNNLKFDISITYIVTTVMVIGIRLIAVRYHLYLPTLYKKEE